MAPLEPVGLVTVLHSFPLSALLVFIYHCFVPYFLLFFFCPQSTSQLGTSQLKIALSPFGDVVKYESNVKQTAQATQEEEPPGSSESGSQSHHDPPRQGRQCLPGTHTGLLRHWLLLSQDWSCLTVEDGDHVSPTLRSSFSNYCLTHSHQVGPSAPRVISI